MGYHCYTLYYKMSPPNLMLATFISVFLISSVSGLKCYVCDSIVGGDDCDDSADRPGKLQVCPQDRNLLKRPIMMLLILGSFLFFFFVVDDSGTSDSTGSSGSDKTDLFTWRGISSNGGWFTNMLMVSSSVWMLDWIFGDTH